MSIVLDIIVVLIVLLNCILMAKRGFIKSLIELVGFILAIFIAINLSAPAAEFTYNKLVEPTVLEKIEMSVENIGNDSSNSIKESANKILDSLPDFISKYIEKNNFDIESVIGSTSAVIDGSTIATKLNQNLVQPIIVTILRYLYTVVLFLISIIIVKILSKLISSIFSGAIFGTANRVLGGILGILKGIIINIVFCLIVSFISTIISSEGLSDAISATVVFKFVLSVLPFTL